MAHSIRELVGAQAAKAKRENVVSGMLAEEDARKLPQQGGAPRLA